MMYGTKEEFDYFECSNCGCLQISSIPADMSKYYPSNYCSFVEKREVPVSRLSTFFRKKSNRYALFKDSWVGRLVNIVLPNGLEPYSTALKVPLNSKSRILDVGCGSGALLIALKNLGFKNVLGCDPYIQSNIKYSNGLQILKGTVCDIEGEWDLIMFNHSFEHAPNQLETLQATSEHLATNGVCVLNMPTVSSYTWKHYGVNWVQLDAPRHLIIHSTTSISQLAKKANLELTKVIYNSDSFQFWGSERYAKNIPLNSSLPESEKTLFSSKEYTRKAAELNRQKQGDMAAFYLSHSPSTS
jgi:2-polyprenyl-3-methyl-5-hydroxy-6-metoxy-1,4-benzoquinol methylase